MVIVGLTGPLSAGKATIAQNLQAQGFKCLRLDLRQGIKSEIAKIALREMMIEWKESWIVYPITTPEEVDIFRVRSYFILLGVDASAHKRFSQYCEKNGEKELRNFLKQDDEQKFNGILECLLSADKVIHNNGSLEQLQEQIRIVDCLNPENIRPSWDTYFIRLAEIAATRSSCAEYKAGAIIVLDKQVRATGYNGTPANMPNCNEGGCLACLGRDFKENCYCNHAEVSALLEIGRNATQGGTIYCTHFPCLECSKCLMQCGIVRIVYGSMDVVDEELEFVMRKYGLEVCFHSPVIGC